MYRTLQNAVRQYRGSQMFQRNLKHNPLEDKAANLNIFGTTIPITALIDSLFDNLCISTEYDNQKSYLTSRCREWCLHQTLNLSSASRNLDLLHPRCWNTVGMFRNMCWLGLVEIRCRVWDILPKRISVTYFGSMWPWSLSSWPLKLTLSSSFPVYHLWKFAKKLVHPFYHAMCMHSKEYAVTRCLSVRLPSVTSRTAKHAIRFSSPSGSHTILAFPY